MCDLNSQKIMEERNINMSCPSKKLVLTVNRPLSSSSSPSFPSFSSSPSSSSLSASAPRTSELSDYVEIPSDTFDTTDRQFFGGFGEIGGYVMTKNEHSILGDLKQYPFPDDIKNQADTIFKKMRYRVRRGKIRDLLVFYCTYCAHLELRRDVNPIQLGKQFGITPGKVQRCYSTFSRLQTGYEPPVVHTSPLSYLPGYCRNMDLSEDAIDEVLNMGQSILDKDQTLYQESPQTVAAGLLRYYLFTTGVIYDDQQKIAKVTDRSIVTIEGMFKRIAGIDNQS